ncbi:L-rhamnose mutarotase [Pontibacter korlensis]
MKLKPGFEEEYQKRHQAIWPELAQALKSAGISDYAIFQDPETSTLFAVQKRSGTSCQELGKTEIVQKWWAFMADIMETHSDKTPVTVPLQKVFYLA